MISEWSNGKNKLLIKGRSIKQQKSKKKKKEEKKIHSSNSTKTSKQ